MYILLSDATFLNGGGPGASVRCFSKAASARGAMAKEYEALAAIGVGLWPNSCSVTKTENSIRAEVSGGVYKWKVFKAVPED